MALLSNRAFLLLSAVAALSACTGGEAPSGDTAAAPVSAPAAPAAPAPPVALAEYAAAPAASAGSCSLDVVNGAASATTSVAAGSLLSVGGWFADAQNTVPADALIVFTGPSRSYSGALVAGGERPDVAQALGSEGARLSGFNAQISLSGIEAGDYALSVVHGGSAPHSCALNKSINVAAGG